MASAAGGSGGGGGARLVEPWSMPLLVSTRKVDKASHYLEMRRALFCLAPSGWAALQTTLEAVGQASLAEEAGERAAGLRPS